MEISEWVSVLGVMMVLGFPLTFLFGVGAGLIWALLGHLPKWFFPLALVSCLVIAGFTRAEARPGQDELQIVLTSFLIPLNLSFAVTVLIVGWVTQVWRGSLSGVGRPDPAS